MNVGELEARYCYYASGPPLKQVARYCYYASGPPLKQVAIRQPRPDIGDIVSSQVYITDHILGDVFVNVFIILGSRYAYWVK
jgi:hypothetical protein